MFKRKKNIGIAKKINLLVIEVAQKRKDYRKMKKKRIRKKRKESLIIMDVLMKRLLKSWRNCLSIMKQREIEEDHLGIEKHYHF